MDDIRRASRREMGRVDLTAASRRFSSSMQQQLQRLTLFMLTNSPALRTCMLGEKGATRFKTMLRKQTKHYKEVGGKKQRRMRFVKRRRKTSTAHLASLAPAAGLHASVWSVSPSSSSLASSSEDKQKTPGASPRKLRGSSSSFQDSQVTAATEYGDRERDVMAGSEVEDREREESDFSREEAENSTENEEEGAKGEERSSPGEGVKEQKKSSSNRGDKKKNEATKKSNKTSSSWSDGWGENPFSLNFDPSAVASLLTHVMSNRNP
uniref:Uncharacterized protein n=1 Tax=Chromera velia CCMP2878 TaxID=1169474 RepID=A0A0G4GL85_9ALVE|eukprot:Cvel_4857.t1-p1 / transcript=Cvel_4857.t1 / gene=Cvel_4857 / organism=Chromera_velia_CCMP2878 / gene_product=hypothetical protein / transcript_product=hypothetical protein / location=Cvel_scaffold219:33916-34710(-) / protein_length=265 / sequence_SO=supercontig / SO=protein_coding / is_pseudo=false